MNIKPAINCIVKKKIITALCIAVSMAAFATLGDGGKTEVRKIGQKKLLSHTIPHNFKYFTLKSGYNYRGSNVFTNLPSKFILLNTVVTYQKGNTTYILPLKKKVLLDKVKFNPAQ